MNVRQGYDSQNEGVGEGVCATVDGKSELQIGKAGNIQKGDGENE